MGRLWTCLLIMTIGCVSWTAPVHLATGAANLVKPSGQADFNGDGFADLAVGAYESVHVLYGSQAGLSAVGNQLWSRDSPGIEGHEHVGFGASLAASDFNGDGFGDLAVGAAEDPEDPEVSSEAGGSVTVIYGSAAGLTAVGIQFWSQASPGIPGTGEAEDLFGVSLAAANFGNGRHADLLVGIPGEDIGAVENAGAVQVLYGSADGLTSTGNRRWTQNSSGISSRTESDDWFGWSVAAGDFGRSGYADAAIGSDEEDVGKRGGAGVVHVMFGSAAGLTSSGSQMWSQNSRGVPGVAEGGDGFGSALAAANLGWDGHADLAVGIWGDNNDAGAVILLSGSGSGLTSAGSQLWSQDSEGIDGVAETEDFFGATLTAGDFGKSGYADLAVGLSEESIGDVQLSGAVNMIYGSARGLTSAGNQLLSPGSAGIKGAVSERAHFGYSVAAGNFGKSGRADLAIGAPGPDIGEDGGPGSGAVHVVYGSATGLTPAGDQLWSPDTPGLLGEPEEVLLFGSALVASQ